MSKRRKSERRATAASPPATVPTRAPTSTTTDASRPKSSGRVTSDSRGDLLNIAQAILSPNNPEDEWRIRGLDVNTLDRISPTKLVEMLADLSPDISRALWDLLRFANPGWECTALQPGSEEPDTQAQVALDDFLKVIGRHYGTPDTQFNRLFLNAFLRGGMFGELVLDPTGRVPVDLVMPDAATLRFRRVDDEMRGSVWQMGQMQSGNWVSLDRPTIRYVPIDPAPGSPYGRPMATAAVFAALFLLGLLHDLRRVVSQQGYPRLDIEVQLESLRLAMPTDAARDQTKFSAWVQATIDEVSTYYGRLQPDDAYVHTDVVKVNRPVGAVDSSSLGAIDGLIKGLERMLVRALKTVPMLMASVEGSSEANANRQYEAYVATIKSLQHLAETLLSDLLGLALQVQGIAATVLVRFAELRASEELRDQQTLTLKIANASAQFAAGWISQDEASEAVTGHAADMPEPRTAAGSGPPVGETGAVDPGANRTRGVKPTGADAPLPAVPETVTISNADLARASAEWAHRFRETEYADLLAATADPEAARGLERVAPSNGRRTEAVPRS